MEKESHTLASSEAEGPPSAPPIDRRFEMPVVNAVFMCAFAAVVVLALLGVFGRSQRSASAQSAGLALSIEYPSRFRYEQLSPLVLRVSNTAPQEIDTLTVRFDVAYLSQFSQIEMVPSADRPWEVDLLDVMPGETRRVSMELQGERYGRHSGFVSASASNTDSVSVRISTFTFP